MKTSLAIWNGGGSGEVKKTPGISDANPIIVIKKIMEGLLDQVVPPAAQRLPFVTDPVSKRLELDLASVDQHVRDEEWEAAAGLRLASPKRLLLDAILAEARNCCADCCGSTRVPAKI